MLLLLVGASGAQAKGILGTGIGPSIGPEIAPNINPLPSVSELLSGIIGSLFSALLSALTPDFLKHADIHTLQWLVALPNPADTSVSPTVGRLEQDMVWVAGALLPTTLIIATLRDSALSLALRAHPANALVRFTGAVFALVLYRFAVKNGVAFVNTLTNTMLSWPVVSQGLHRTVLAMFGGSLLIGQGGEFLALLGVISLVFAVSMFVLKVALFQVLHCLYVAGPLFIGVSPLPALGFLARAWLLGLGGVCLIPVGWCIIFSTAGAMSLDATHLSGGVHIGSRVLGAFAALATFYLSFKWPQTVVSHVLGALGGIGMGTGGVSAGSGGSVSNGVLAQRAQRARVRLQATALAGGRGLGAAAGALGAPKGGLVGAVGRGARRPAATLAATGAIAAGPPRARPTPKPGTAADRAAKAKATLRDTPSRMREAWRNAGTEGRSGAGGQRGPRPGGSQSGSGKRKGRGAARHAPRGSSAGAGSAAVPPGAAGSGGAGGARGAKRGPGGGGDSSRPASRPTQAAGQARGAGAQGQGASRAQSASRQASAPARPHAGSGGSSSTPRSAGRTQGTPSSPRDGRKGSGKPPRGPDRQTRTSSTRPHRGKRGKR